jgi:hypothetical protein
MTWSMSRFAPVGKALLGFGIPAAHRMGKVEILMGFLHRILWEHQITVIMNLSGGK